MKINIYGKMTTKIYGKVKIAITIALSVCLLLSPGLNAGFAQTTNKSFAQITVKSLAQTTGKNSQNQTIKLWTLRDCLDYSLENNIQVKSSVVTTKSNYEDVLQAKASRLPTLNASSSQSYINQNNLNSDGSYNNSGTYTGNYAINTGITIYNGGKITNSISQQQLLYKSSELSLKEAQNNIEISVTQAYLAILYANESLKTIKKAVELSQAQFERSKALYTAGMISSVDLAQIESQLSSDKYQQTVGENNLAQSRLSLKQLLELDVDQTFELYFPELDSTDVMENIPLLKDVYTKALEVMPQIENSRIQIESSKVGEKIASADMLPSVSMNAALGAGNKNNLSQSAGLSLNIPIFNKRSVKTSVNKAKLQTEQAELSSKSSAKDLLSTVESLYLDAKSAQSRYKAASDKLAYTELSYNMVTEKYNAGMKNTVELLTEKQNYISALQEQTEAKYQAVLSIKLLNFYQNQSIEL